MNIFYTLYILRNLTCPVPSYIWFLSKKKKKKMVEGQEEGIYYNKIVLIFYILLVWKKEHWYLHI
jgi:hypothetical protein